MNETKTISLEQFNINNVKPGSICVFLGKRKTGKTTLMRDLLYNLKNKLSLGYVMSSTDNITKDFSSIIPPKLIYDEYREDKVKALVDRQKKASKEQWKLINAFLILDDVLQEKGKWAKDPSMKFIFFNGRHINLTLLIAVQYSMGLPADFRSNIDYIFLSRFNTRTDKKKIFENYAGQFGDYATFEAAFDQVTENNGCLVIDNSCNSNDIRDTVFHYRATHRPQSSFKLCHHSLWNKEQNDFNDKVNVRQFKIIKK